MHVKYRALSGRGAAAIYIKDTMFNQKHRNYLLIGGHGSGKKHVMSKLIRDMGYENYSILNFVGEQIVEVEKKHQSTKNEFSISLSVYLGISWNQTEKNDNKTNYVLNCLRSIKKDNIVLTIPDIENCPSEVKDLVNLIQKNRIFFENQLSKKIYILLSTSRFFVDEFEGFEIIELEPYTVDDIEYYVREILGYQFKVSDEKLKFIKLQEICCSDLNLVNLLYRDLLENKLMFADSLDQLIKYRLKCLKDEGELQSISSKDLEEIILSCALSAEEFTRHEISEITLRDEETVNDSFQISIKNKLFMQVSHETFDFISEDIKGILQSEMIKKHNTRLLNYYNYLVEHKSDEYYLRAYYLIRYERSVTEDSFSLLLLATSKAILFNDTWICDKIISDLKEYGNLEYLNLYTLISESYKKHKNCEYTESNLLIGQCDLYKLSELSQSELRRLMFKNHYLAGEVSSYDFKQTLISLIDFARNELIIPLTAGAKLIDETIQRLRIIFDIAPYILDGKNDYELFQELYDISRSILRKENRHSRQTTIIKYITNVFNRKAFLFANPMQAMPYYEEAKAFFKKYGIWDEYCVTLVCQAGTCLACYEYMKACELCEEAHNVCKRQEITIPKPQKLWNNYEIAKFLVFEDKNPGNIIAIQEYAAELATKLENMADNTSSATKNVILTNSASLYLYANMLDKYIEVKDKIQVSLNCQDVSNVADHTINDFYRYYFAWYEIFYNIQIENWNKCKIKFDQIKDFIPALFRKQENIWKMKNESVKQLIESKQKTDGYHFSLNLVNTKFREKELSRFYHRGLMLSDLQYTSFD